MSKFSSIGSPGGLVLCGGGGGVSCAIAKPDTNKCAIKIDMFFTIWGRIFSK